MPRELSESRSGTADPIIFLVSSDEAVLGALETDLRRRFGNDTYIMAADEPRPDWRGCTRWPRPESRSRW